MNNKMTTNSQLSTIEPKKQKQKLSKQLEQHRITEMELTWRVINRGVGGGEWGEKVQGISSIIGRHKIDREVKNNVGNRETKEPTCIVHGHKLSGGILEGEGCRAEGDTKYLNCNSIINKIYFKKKKFHIAGG